MASPSNIREVRGSVPGLLDPTQPERLLRLPGSSLQFAAFDPLTATARQDLCKQSIKEEYCRPRRIIIEIAQSGDSFWRYVPNARLENGVEDEGEWPRAINICGEVIQCFQDQWDIYKLDPLYECLVRVHPHLSQITHKTNVKTAPQNAQQKRRASLPPGGSTPVPLRKRRLYNDLENSITEVDKEESIDEMIVDPLPQANNTEDAKKRKRPDPLVPDESEKGKRARTVSPLRTMRREKSKRKKKEQEWFARLIAETARQMQELAEKESGFTQPVDDNEYTREAAIEESRRKLAELEADKPLWEAAARQRMKREEEEEESIRVKAESLRTREKEEAKRKARILREAEEKKKGEEERLQREEATRRERERRQRQQQRWAFGPWTTQRALERYKNLSEEFDSTKFSVDLPLTMEAVPWPVLTPPGRLNVTDVDWEAVEKFFAGVRDYMKPQDYKTFVEKSHRRFHPDRWRGRSLLKSVLDETERDCMEVAANTVAQALTPLWRELTGR